MQKDILYRDPVGSELTQSMKDRCRLDVRYPRESKNFPTIVWFHGGGLKGGDRYIPQPLLDAPVGMVTASYRLSPQNKCPAYLEDAAAAVAWVFRNIEQYGGDPQRIYISGHSAGGYLVAMLALDKRWLAPYGLDPAQLPAVFPLSGQMITHFTVREERGLADTDLLIDEFAPLGHINTQAPPLVLITGDREKEMLGRYEENAYLWRMMKVIGHPATELEEIKDADHGSMVDPGCKIMLDWIEKHTPGQPAEEE